VIDRSHSPRPKFRIPAPGALKKGTMGTLADIGLVRLPIWQARIIES
jgi:hypothetical protein